PYLVIADLDSAQSDARIFSAAVITEALLEEYFAEQITKERRVKWNDEAKRVEAREATKLGALILGEEAVQNVGDAEIAIALLGAIRAKGLDVMTWSKEALALRQRIGFLNYMKEEKPDIAKIVSVLPDLSDAWLLDHLETWLLPHLEGIKSFKACRRLDTYPMLLGMLSWEQKQRIDRLAPPKLQVPSGSKIALNYENPDSPVLSVRLQELFGMVETPQLIDGRVAMTIELLSPAHRPMQVTKDLRSFWENTYHEVKKELRGKYKRHYWPDDPFSAQATGKTKKNM
ncbi:MAG: ATP-dependent helicase HrpB, partial [Thiovulaceae bacterium]|nr:ATP-dependent helicase HrpB [Sulfurimonadaceae bacterium]